MKTFRAEIRLRNNRIKQRREEMGLSAPQAAEAAGMSYPSWNRLESMKNSPVASEHSVSRAPGEWLPAAMAIADFFKVPPEELFPEAVKRIKTARKEVLFDPEDLPQFAADGEPLFLPSHEDAVAQKELAAAARSAMAECCDEREQTVMRLRYEQDLTLDEISQRIGVSREMTGRIERAAIRKTRKGMTPRVFYVVCGHQGASRVKSITGELDRAGTVLADDGEKYRSTRWSDSEWRAEWLARERDALATGKEANPAWRE